MRESFLSARKLSEFPLWGKLKHKRVPIFFDLEITARCNHNCRHCDINLPAGDKDAQARELSLADIKKIVDEAVSLGALCCLITGGEPLLRDDFFDIYRYIKQKGLLVSVFTNATLVNDEHIELFTKTPPTGDRSLGLRRYKRNLRAGNPKARLLCRLWEGAHSAFGEGHKGSPQGHGPSLQLSRAKRDRPLLSGKDIGFLSF